MNAVSRRGFLGGAVAAVAMPSFAAERPRLVFGILSDMHIVDAQSAKETVHALEYFRSQNVDAVVLVTATAKATDVFGNEMAATGTGFFR